MSELLDFILGDDDPYLQRTQAPVARPDPIERPAPIVRPGEEPPARRSAPRPEPRPPRATQPANPRFQFKPADAPPMGPFGPPSDPSPPVPGKSGDLLDFILGDEPKAGAQPEAQAQPVTVPFEGYKDPKREGWLEWAANNVAGRKDPRFRGLPSISDVLKDEIYTPDGGSDASRAAYRHIVAGHGLTSDTDGQANIVKRAIGDRFIKLEKDAYGAPVVHYRGQGGLPAKAYINRPGLDWEDVGDTTLQTLPYLLMGRAMGKLTPGAGPTGISGQGLGAASTSVLQDLGAMMMGSEKAPDPGKAGIVGTIAAGAQGLSPIIGNFIRRATERGMIRNGQLTPQGAELAKKAGIDPDTITPDLAEQFAKEFARVRDPSIAGQSVRTKEFNVPVTRGQLDKDPGRLLNEKAMRYGAYGDDARQTMQGFDRQQAKAIEEAAFGRVMGTLNPARAGAPVKPSEAGTSIQGGLAAARDVAEGAESAAWKQVGPQYATPDALQSLPSRIAQEIGDLSPLLAAQVDGRGATPVSTAMLDVLRKFHKGEPMAQADEFLGNVAKPELDGMRRTLGKLVSSAEG